MFELKDVSRVGGVLVAAAAIAALGFAAGYLAGRDPERLRRWARAAAGGLERMQTALAETREELADLWAEVRADARADVEEAAMAAAQEAAAKASAAAVVKAAAAATRRRAAASRAHRGPESEGAPRGARQPG
jgi:hypothetical protein